ncbi:amino acid adenylation domain-containing protein [Streptomyces sp. NPDC001922]|uniref:non-ribosomal peptide synthetase n=1 Tax=Streptomyces sp. NPDC001922 TaxID=3364624 RepID=UPI00368F8A68
MTAPVEGYRLSFQQQSLWRPGGPAAPGLRSQVLVTVDGDLDRGRLTAALETVVARHEILRSTYWQVPGVRTALLVVHDAAGLRPHATETDLRDMDEETQRHRIRATARAQWALPYGESGGPVVRTVLLRLGPRRHALLLTTTALAADSRTLHLLADELADAYAGRPAVPGAPLQYTQYAEWQHQVAEESGTAAPTTAATDRGAGPPELPFPLGRSRRGAARPERNTVTLPLPDATVAAVHACAAWRGIRPDAVLLACWQALAARVTGETGFTVGTELTGRDHEETTDGLGPYARWTGIRARLGGDPALDTLAARAERALTDAEKTPESAADAGTDGRDGWDVSFACRPQPRPGTADGITFTVARADVTDDGASLQLECLLGPSGALARWHHRPDRFDEAYVRCLAQQYTTLLDGLLTDPAAPVSTVGLLDPGTRDRLLRRAAGPVTPADGDGPDSRVLHRLVEQQAARTPDAVAVRAPNGTLTYRELTARADRWARVLRARGTGPGTRVAVAAGHDAHLLVGLLAVLTTGACYVPLDPGLPPRRARDLLDRAGCRILLTAGEPGPTHGALGPGVEHLDLAAPGTEPAADDGPRPHAPVHPEHLAYIMFTSGSTGTPKGVMVPHRAICHYLRWAARTYSGDGGDGALAHSSIAFDLTVTSLFLPLVTGRTVHLDPAWRDTLALSAELGRRSGLDLVKLTPSHLQVVNHALTPEDMPGTARNLVIGGEALIGEAVRPWLTHAPGTRVVNEYGPTEAAVGCCAYELGPDDVHGPVPIGRPADGTEIHVLDESLEPVATGVPGELCIGGDGLALGYLDNPAATAERFVPHPFSTEPGRRLYRTGDLACHGPDGLLHWLGRADDQVKIRGVRVEPEEIRTALLEHPAVRDVAVVKATDDDRGDHLAAHVVVGPGPDTSPERLRAFLAERLPAHLVPDTWNRLTAIPLTANGKVDRSALPAAASAGRPGDASGAPGESPDRPGDPVERAIAEIFTDLLGAGPVRPADDFFDLGGHSLLAVRLMARVNAAFRSGIPVSALFSEPRPGHSGSPATPAHLARLVKEGTVLRPEDSLVPLRSRGDGTPLFCIHPAGGDIAGYRDLAAADGALRRPLYALQAPVTKSGEPDRSIGRLASHYLAAIRSVQPAGPYLLLGWSMGGVVAFEMARLLADRGERTAMLVLVESYLAGQVPDEDEDVVRARFAEQLLHPGGDLTALQDSERTELDRRLRANRAHVRAVRAYRPEGRHPGPVTLVQAAEQDPELRRAAVAAWREVCDPVGPHVVAGGHFTLLRPPSVDTLGRLIEDAVTRGTDAPSRERAVPGS